MTLQECIIVTAYTGVSMLQGEDLNLFYEYVEKKFGYPIWTHDMISKSFWEKLKAESKEDFISLCKNAKRN